jgi:hypothetical protein
VREVGWSQDFQRWSNRRFVIDFEKEMFNMSKSVVTEIQSHITVMLPVKSAEDFKAVEQILQSANPQMIAAADAMGTVHFARFIRMSDINFQVRG